MVMHLVLLSLTVDEALHHEDERAEKAEYIFELSFLGLHFVGNFIAVSDLVTGITHCIEGHGEQSENAACALHNVETTSCILYSLFTAYLDSFAVAHAYFGGRTNAYKVLTCGLFAESMLSTVFCSVVFIIVRKSRRTKVMAEKRQKLDAREQPLVGSGTVRQLSRAKRDAFAV